MPDFREYMPTIDAFTPAFLPMARLVDHLIDPSGLLGHPESIHRLRVEEGSAKLAYQVEEAADPKVTDRILGAGAGVAPAGCSADLRAPERKAEQCLSRLTSAPILRKDP